MQGRVVLAIVLVVLGGWLLLDNIGIAPDFDWDRLWPILLIIIGAVLLLRVRRSGKEASPPGAARPAPGGMQLAPGPTQPAAGGAQPASGPAPVAPPPDARSAASGSQPPPQTPPQEDSLALEGAARGRIVFRHGAGRLSVGAGAAPGLLYWGRFNWGVNRMVDRREEVLDVTLSSPHQEWIRWATPWNWASDQGGQHWEVRLTGEIPLSLVFEGGAAETTVDLSDLKVEDLSLKTGASSTRLTLPAQAGYTRARISSGAASVTIRVPEGVAGRISGVMGLGALHVDQARFPRQDGLNESPGFATAANRVEIDIDGGVGSVTVI